MWELRIATVSTFELPCGCSGFEVDTPGIGSFRVYEHVCFGESKSVSKEEPAIVFIREQTQMDLSGSDREAESGYGFSFPGRK